MSFVIEDEIRMQYAGLYLLSLMIEDGMEFNLVLPQDQEVLEPILQNLFKKKYITIKDDRIYAPTDLGRDTFNLFDQRYADFLSSFDIYCAVDLEEGEFAMAYYHDYPDPAAWEDFLNQNNWTDLRIAVAEAKGLDPVEIVFMSFISEGRFGRSQEVFSFDLLLGTVWDEIAGICTTSVKLNDLGYVEDGEMISSRDVVEDIIARGEELKQELRV